jgi:hypothetical protein
LGLDREYLDPRSERPDRVDRSPCVSIPRPS